MPREHVHTVQFYGDDGVLLHELKGYIGSALDSGSSAIIIATEGKFVALDQQVVAIWVRVAAVGNLAASRLRPSGHIFCTSSVMVAGRAIHLCRGE
jgi:hypothetical protein